ncbi:MAG: hypothetical protein ACXWT0_03850 [Methylobacter sp.]
MASLKEMLAAKRGEIAKSSGQFAKTVKLKSGKQRFRLLPSWLGQNEFKFWQEFGQHFIKDSDGKLKAVYVCTEKTYQKPCPVCDAIRDGIQAAENDDTKELMKEALASQRILLNVLQVESDRETPVVLEITAGTLDKILSIIEDNLDEEDETFNLLTNINTGLDIIIDRQGTGLNTKYDVNAALKGSKPVNPDVLKKLVNLTEFVAQEAELGLLKATEAVKAALQNSMKALPSSKDSEFDDSDDVPHHPSAATGDIIEGEYETKSEAGISDDELNSLLDELDD